MKTRRTRSWIVSGAAAMFALAACGGDEAPEGGAAAPAAPVEETAAPPPQPPQEMRLEVDVAAKQVRVFRRDQLEKSYGIAVGRPEWPTQNGNWNVTQVVWNPGWTPPPDEEWSKKETPKEPGAPDNPLGTVQIVYDPPRTIHGTNEPESIGKAVSHGSIRMTNAEAEELAQMVMQAGGAPKDAAWIQQARSNRTVRQEVALPNPIPISVINGVDNADAIEGDRPAAGAASGSAAGGASGTSRADTASRSTRTSGSDTASRSTRSSRSDTTARSSRTARPDTAARSSSRPTRRDTARTAKPDTTP
ncbi:MAG TPA: L,D-transpeptidase [Longimicrobium sp.]|nr:L,D-transpeptidase [Longimicrobium sp.]